jgi:phosphomannomutase/phosphoglucomutase
MNPRIFREYDIRGVVDQDLTDDTVRLLGRGLAAYLFRQGKSRVVAGRDV